MNIPEYYRDLLHPRLHPLGGASSLHAYWNEIERKQNECKEFDMQKFRNLLKNLQFCKSETSVSSNVTSGVSFTLFWTIKKRHICKLICQRIRKRSSRICYICDSWRRTRSARSSRLLQKKGPRNSCQSKISDLLTNRSNCNLKF